MARSRYWVSPGDEGWFVSREDHVLARYPDQARAIGAAIELARSDAPAELLVKNLDGLIEDRRAFDTESEVPTAEEPASADSTGARFPVVHRRKHQATMMMSGDLAHEPWLVQIIREILHELEDPALQEIVVDMGGVTDFDMQSVAGWVGLEHFVREHERRLVIVNASPAVLRVLEEAARTGGPDGHGR